jgi:uncharacterized protein (TIGR03435 family)
MWLRCLSRSTPVLALVSLSALIYAQQPPTVPDVDMAFEVTSIKRNLSGVPQMVIRTPPNGLDATNVNVRFLVRFAYDTQEFLVVDGPDWTVDDHFDVRARTTAAVDAPQLRAMLRALLADRFQLVTRREQREMPVDVLSLMPVSGARRLGVPTSCVPDSTGRDQVCGMRVAFGLLAGRAATVAELASSLTFMNRRVFLDRSGLTDRYDFTLNYTPDAVALMKPEEARADFPRVDPNGPSLKTALREQLGLDLQSRRQPVEVIVISEISPPSPD